ncbi:MAG: tRNA pseudouridine(55) synthase TruB, partial [Gemmatimonadetes bacterium]|nr:tRNA pseudouridine(55) synthase TruB [Gemmatimonadota bacterium]NIR78720.1 tRNA pseudouridine(55) synthase TruB [Gemmatimonadota bacterium]NIT87359.1 tRNA pseudouridine(55) synthase TruB [Gemmatimonadota bacterium]NIU31203.1 tRNA pseudouridine(55) synthase TruB [Gemmatimonadota bacterium]NIV61563.1 tRNA pseudouridine(55) synthase TruB [Gemmatimonadota bacterium]
ARALAHLPALELTEEEVRRVAHGQTIREGQELPEGGPVALLAEGRLAAVAEPGARGLQPRKVFVRA